MINEVTGLSSVVIIYRQMGNEKQILAMVAGRCNAGEIFFSVFCAFNLSPL